MKNLLYLVHRLPYPPNKGDKITSFNQLKYLSARYNVFLGCFVDDPLDWQYVNKVEKYCADLCTVRLNPATSKFLSLQGFLTGEALSLPYYRNRVLQNWVDKVLENQTIDSILILSGAMAQYIPQNLNKGVRTVLDLEDVDSDKWKLFAKDHHWPFSLILQRESRRLFNYEVEMTKMFDVTLFVSQEEAKMFQKMAPEVANKVKYRVQGVNSNYFDPSLSFKNPYGDKAKVLVFTGVMDYWPNIDAVIWFAREVMPKVTEVVPGALFYIVGMNPVKKVKALVSDPAIIVTGGVADVRPYLAHATGAVLPLRMARGIQNKILEAMAMEKQVVATPQAIHGIEAHPGFTPMIESTAKGFAEKVISLFTPQQSKLPTESRTCVLKHYNWDINLRVLDDLLDGSIDLSSSPALRNVHEIT